MSEDITTQQMELLMVPQSDKWEQPETALGPAHTGNYFRERDPIKYAAVLEALRGGAHVTTVAKVYKISVNTVYGMIDRELGGREKWNAGLLDKLRTVASLGAERLIDLLPDCKDIKSASIVVGIAAEKVAMLSGLPTSISEVRHTVDTSALEEFNQRLTELRAARGRVVEEPAALPVETAA